MNNAVTHTTLHLGGDGLEHKLCAVQSFYRTERALDKWGTLGGGGARGGDRSLIVWRTIVF